MPQMPPIGAEIPCSVLAIGSTIEYQNETITCDLRGGVKHRVDVDPDDPTNSVRLRTVGFKVTAESDAGLITFEQNDVDVDAKSILRQTQESPPKYLHRDVQAFTIAFQDRGDAVVLVTREPMVCEAEFAQFPPRGDIYKLTKPVDLVDPDNPDQVVGRLTAFTSKRGGL
ncbi:hypothetical protein AB0D27_45205 [Streptomyces sp. NPDC048415]|uniref:hypothetical protein n=1 Tax=Streptomyces sp. NPDC048415 TaxID=3154822 RepID=UPI003444A56B